MAGYQYSDPQAKGVIEQAKALPHFGEQGTNKAFLNMGDGEGQSTKDRAQFQQLAVKQVCACPNVVFAQGWWCVCVSSACCWCEGSAEGGAGVLTERKGKGGPGEGEGG